MHTWGKIPDPASKSKSRFNNAVGINSANFQQKSQNQSSRRRYVLICDEAHYMQNLATKRTQDALALAAPALAVVLATGTPVKNAQPSNLFPLLQACRHPLSRDVKAFEQRYCGGGSLRVGGGSGGGGGGGKKGGRGGKQNGGATNLQELQEKLLASDCLLRKTKAECLSLPPKNRRIVSSKALSSLVLQLDFCSKTVPFLADCLPLGCGRGLGRRQGHVRTQAVGNGGRPAAAARR
eukprot:SAG22_NODE_704_length_7777_cov_6.153295_11_plen_237_part_00